jgi:uncharacterized protein involved in type VI secretion and phage assembly
MSDVLEPRNGPPGKMFGTYLAEVVSVKDDKKQGRVQVRLLGFDGVGAQNAAIWARVAVPFAGKARGAFFIPSKGDEVVVNFVNGDPRLPLVTGGVWNGKNQQPEILGGAGDAIDRWTFVGKQGTRIAIVEEQAGATIKLSTPNDKQTITITAQSSGKIELKIQGSTITMDNQGVAVQTSKAKVTATSVEMKAANVKIDSPMVQCTGVVKAQSVISPSIVGNVYTPGMGNLL